MKVISSKPRGQRIFKCYPFKKDGKIFRRPFWIEPEDGMWWFDIIKGQWFQGATKGKLCTSSYYCVGHGHRGVWSLKACKRLVNQWDLPKGTRIRCGLPWVGYHFIIIKN